jgi:hypothetical protein
MPPKPARLLIKEFLLFERESMVREKWLLSGTIFGHGNDGI